MMEQTVKQFCDGERAACKAIEERVRSFVKEHDGCDGTADWLEIRAQAILAVRALEEARMRLGKVIQYFDGGVSCYDRDLPQCAGAHSVEATP